MDLIVLFILSECPWFCTLYRHCLHRIHNYRQFLYHSQSTFFTNPFCRFRSIIGKPAALPIKLPTKNSFQNAVSVKVLIQMDFQLLLPMFFPKLREIKFKTK